MPDTVGAVIVAAGSGTRMAGADKLFIEVDGRSLLAHAIAAFQECRSVDRIVLVMALLNLKRGRELVERYGFTKVSALVKGGERRQDSVRLGLEALGGCDYVAVHDGARPLVTPKLIERGLEAARETGAAVPAVPLVDTVKEAGPGGTVVRTLDRSRMWAVQTPQLFRYDLLLRAHRAVTADVTDDAAMVEALGEPVQLFEGSRANLKVTTAEDLVAAARLLSSSQPLPQAEEDATPRAKLADGCPFCHYEDVGAIVYEDDQVFAIVDKQPINRYQLLVIPKEHYTSLSALPDELTARVMLVVKQLSAALRRVAKPDAITHLSDDDVTGVGINLVDHFKFHLIPRYTDDGVKIEWNRGPAPGPAELAKIAEEVRGALAGPVLPRGTR